MSDLEYPSWIGSIRQYTAEEASQYIGGLISCFGPNNEHEHFEITGMEHGSWIIRNQRRGTHSIMPLWDAMSACWWTERREPCGVVGPNSVLSIILKSNDIN